MTAFAGKVELGSTDACWSAVIAQLEADVYYAKIDDDVVYIQVPLRLAVLIKRSEYCRMLRVTF